MYAVVRTYTAASALMDMMERKKAEVEQLLKGVDGFASYHAIRAGDRLTTVTVCADRAGTEASTKVAGEWIRGQLGAGAVGAPQVSDGEVFLDFAAGGTPSLGSPLDAPAIRARG